MLLLTCMHKKFIHIAFDSIFLDYTIDQFETIVPGESNYIVDTSNNYNDIKYIKQKQKITPVNLDNDDLRTMFIKDFPIDAVLILHCLNQNMIDIVNRINKNNKIVWIAWGAEVNSLPKLRKNYYLPRTKAILDELNPPSLRSKMYVLLPELHQILYKLKRKVDHPTTQKLKALKRINYAGIFVKEDFDLFNTTYNLKMNWLWYCYYNIDDTIGNTNKTNSYNRTNNILIGNSADPRNNHIDAFNLLDNFNLGAKKIICPLSYGTNLEGYVDKVILEGRNMFNDNFSPLIEFMPLNEYNEIISSCDIVIFNHNLQQAVGNIISAIWQGAKVYLNNINPLISYFKRIGIKIFSIQDELTHKNPDALLGLTENQIIRNKDMLRQELSKESVYKNTERLILQLKN